MQSPWRVACLRIPRFPIGVLWRGTKEPRVEAPADQLELTLAASPKSPSSTRPPLSTSPWPELEHWDEQLLALNEGETIRAVTAAAGRRGVRAGMRLPTARAICAGLELRDWDELTVTAAITRTTADLVTVAPQVTPVAGALGTWWIGASGFDALGGEHGLIDRLLAIARRWHPRSRVAIADSCVAARAATWATNAASTIVPHGGCEDYLSSAPLGLIPIDEELRDALRSLGIRTLGAFAALGPDHIERRWGDVGLSAWRLAIGRDPRRPVLNRPESKRTVSVELPAPTTSTEPILFLARAALDRLVSDLVADGRAAAAVAVTLTLDGPGGALPSAGPSHKVTREIRPARAVARVAPLFEQVRSLLDVWGLPAPARALEISIVATVPLSGEQGDLLQTEWRDPAAAEAALDHLRLALGPDTVVRPSWRDAHCPDSAGAWVESETARVERAPDFARSGVLAPCARTAVLRLLEQPELVDVESGDGMPCAMWWKEQRWSFERAMGPERLTGEWWRDDSRFSRDYWRCESGSADFIVFRDYTSEPTWYLHGWYD